jgi:hypothetical protein
MLLDPGALLDGHRPDFFPEQHVAHGQVVLAALSPDDGTLTRTMKPRRKQVRGHLLIQFSFCIDILYIHLAFCILYGGLEGTVHWCYRFSLHVRPPLLDTDHAFGLQLVCR